MSYVHLFWLLIYIKFLYLSIICFLPALIFYFMHFLPFLHFTFLRAKYVPKDWKIAYLLSNFYLVSYSSLFK